ncbi:MAG: hypothetical protein HOV67_17095 [Kribbellaceae bacterium]|nr:hypothetical protein [Kribbellaceae bacterium]
MAGRLWSPLAGVVSALFAGYCGIAGLGPFYLWVGGPGDTVVTVFISVALALAVLALAWFALPRVPWQGPTAAGVVLLVVAVFNELFPGPLSAAMFGPPNGNDACCAVSVDVALREIMLYAFAAAAVMLFLAYRQRRREEREMWE